MTQARPGFLLVFKCRNAVLVVYQSILTVPSINPKTVKVVNTGLSVLSSLEALSVTARAFAGTLINLPSLAFVISSDA